MSAPSPTSLIATIAVEVRAVVDVSVAARGAIALLGGNVRVCSFAAIAEAILDPLFHAFVSCEFHFAFH
jgi:hypothetical protein